MSLRTCNACGWVHMGVTREYAEKQVADFNAYVRSLPEDVHKKYWGGRFASIDDYATCGRCGGPWHNTRPSIKGDCPMGCTIGPILWEETA